MFLMTVLMHFKSQIMQKSIYNLQKQIMENSDNDSGEEEGGLSQEQVEQLAQLQV